MISSTFRLPNDTQRISIVGRTGSGKTQAAAWHLSKRNFHVMPWTILDFKYDPLLQEIGAKELPLGEMPDREGVYITHPFPDDKEGIDKHLWQIWNKQNTGVYIDEGYMVGDSPAFRALLTQGRSKGIPMIILSQRPVWLSRFVFSEADFFQVFQLNVLNDRKMVESFLRQDTNLDKPLPDYHSYYYDVGKNDLKILKPVPSADQILKTFNDRLTPIQETRQRIKLL